MLIEVLLSNNTEQGWGRGMIREFKRCSNNKVNDCSSIHDYNTRFAQDALALPKPNSISLKKSFSYREAVAWNNLPSDLEKIDSLLTFKRSISVSNA